MKALLSRTLIGQLLAPHTPGTGPSESSCRAGRCCCRHTPYTRASASRAGRCYCPHTPYTLASSCRARRRRCRRTRDLQVRLSLPWSHFARFCTRFPAEGRGTRAPLHSLHRAFLLPCGKLLLPPHSLQVRLSLPWTHFARFCTRLTAGGTGPSAPYKARRACEHLRP